MPARWRAGWDTKHADELGAVASLRPRASGQVFARRAGAESDLGDGLGRSELRGMAAGPAAYLRARRAQDPEHLRAVAP